MIKTDQVRIINVSSIGHKFYPNFDMDDLKFERTANPKLIEIYCISKLCNILFTNELVKKLEPLGKNQNLIELHLIVEIIKCFCLMNRKANCM